MAPKTERRYSHGDESRRRILEATAQIAAERGYEGTSISLVSKRSGLPASSIYWHFADKDELIATVIEESFARWLATLPAWSPPRQGEDLLVHCREVWRESSAALLANQDFLRLGLLLTLERRPSEPRGRVRFLECRKLTLQRLAEWFAACLDWAGAPPSDDTARRLAATQMALADGLFIGLQTSEDDQVAGELWDFAFSLLASVIRDARSANGNHLDASLE